MQSTFSLRARARADNRTTDSVSALAERDQATLPYLSSVGYALMFMVEAKIFMIKLAGFDGFEKDDPRQSQNQEIIDLFQSKYGQDYKLEFITPTSYRINQ